MQAADSYDVIVVGGGSTGTNVAWYARDNGLSVALVEQELVGGECSYWACIPSKALLAPGEALAAAQRLPGAAQAVTGSIDASAVFERRTKWANGWDDHGQARWVERIGADLLRGTARLAGERAVEVQEADGATRRLEARRAVVLANGSVPNRLPDDALDGARVWDSRDITTAEHVPERLLIVGGGAVGCEMAQAYYRLGAREVTLVQRGPRLLTAHEPFAGELLAEVLDAEGITVRTGTAVRGVHRDAGDAPVRLTLDDGGELVGDELLVAIGRRPNTEGLGLESVGAEPDKLEVDDHLRVRGVAGGWLYAAGDVNGRALLTHQGKYQARLIGDIVAGKEAAAWADHVAVPHVVFTDPNVAAVGLTEAEAREAGRSIEVVTADPTRVAGGALHGHRHGGAKLVLDAARRVVIGATFVGPGAGEQLHAATMAIVGEIPLDRLWHAVPAFPTVSEVWLRLLETERGIT